MGLAGQADVVGVAAGAGKQALILDAADRLTDSELHVGESLSRETTI